MLRIVTLSLVVMVFVGLRAEESGIAANPPEGQADNSTVGEAPQPDPAQRQADKDGLWDQVSINFGPALMFTGYPESNIESAEIQNGKVVVTKESDFQIDLALETHVSLGKHRPWVQKNDPSIIVKQTSHGVYFAVVPGEKASFSVGSMGYMFSKSSGSVGGSMRSFNFGIGATVNTGYQKLSTGFIEGEDAPAGASSVVIKEYTQIGYSALVSYSVGF